MDKKINRDNIDSYYELINTKIDYYFDKNISAKSLFNYFNKDYGMNKFIEREELGDIQGIKKVIKDVVEDRTAIDEGVKTFEQYNQNSSIFNIKFDITQDIEQIIADHYRVSLGHIQSDLNKINLKGLKGDKELYVFTMSNLRDIYINVATNMYNIFTQSLDFEYTPLNIKMDIDPSVIDKEGIINLFYSKVSGNTDIVEELIYIEDGGKYDMVGDIGNELVIFEKNIK